MKLLSINVLLVLILTKFNTCSSSKSPKEERIKTSYEIAQLLKNGKADEIKNLILLDFPDLENIEHDCRGFKYVANKYGIPDTSDTSKYIYSVDQNDPVYPYIVGIKIFKGEDTLWNWNLKNITLIVKFGPDRLNAPNKIATYEITYNYKIIWGNTHYGPQ